MAEITLLDGGMGQELVARSGDDPTPLWATRVMIDHPGMVRDIHSDYFNAGASVATTNTYAIHHDRLDRFGLDGEGNLAGGDLDRAPDPQSGPPGSALGR